MKNKRMYVIILCCLIVALSLLIVFKVAIPSAKYKKAITCWENKQYEEAIETLSSIKSYKDSASVLKEIEADLEEKEKYDKANGLYNENKFAEAYAIFEELGDYEDSAKMAAKAKDEMKDEQYDLACSFVDEEKYDEALNIFEELKDYKDSVDKIEQIKLIQKDNQYVNAYDLMMNYQYGEALELFRQLGDYRDSTDLVNLCQIAASEVNDVILFGSYEQDNNTENGTEPIEWIVLAKEDNRLLLLSKYCLFADSYNYKQTHMTWENASLRIALNYTFCDAAFSDSEKEKIADTLVVTPTNEEKGSIGGNDTIDKVFILDKEAANTYFTSAEARLAQATPYLYAYVEKEIGSGQRVVDDDTLNAEWWLRDPGYATPTQQDVYEGSVLKNTSDRNSGAYNMGEAIASYAYMSEYACFVGKSGEVASNSLEVAKRLPIRPALWLQIY